MEVEVFRPEIPVRVMWVFSAAMSVFALLTILPDGSASDPYWWGMMLACSAAAVVSVRGFLVRVVADSEGINIVNMFTRQRLQWDQIDRFEVTAGRRACVVSSSGQKHRFSGQQKSLAESLLERPNRTDDVVGTLNARLARARRVSS